VDASEKVFTDHQFDLLLADGIGWLPVLSAA
jgi:hypothetical protein